MHGAQDDAIHHPVQYTSPLSISLSLWPRALVPRLQHNHNQSMTPHWLSHICFPVPGVAIVVAVSVVARKPAFRTGTEVGSYHSPSNCRKTTVHIVTARRAETLSRRLLQRLTEHSHYGHGVTGGNGALLWYRDHVDGDRTQGTFRWLKAVHEATTQNRVTKSVIGCWSPVVAVYYCTVVVCKSLSCASGWHWVQAPIQLR